MAGRCDAGQPVSATNSDNLTIALAGNPNCGKSALFNAFTGIRQKTGNWPGVTVDRKEGFFHLDNHEVAVIDLPGSYSLDARSLDGYRRGPDRTQGAHAGCGLGQRAGRLCAGA